MKGVARKSWRQEPGEERDWPPPSAPAAVCWGKIVIRKYSSSQNRFTMAKLYPSHKGCQSCGQSGMFMSWLCTAITFVSTSQTTHLLTVSKIALRYKNPQRRCQIKPPRYKLRNGVLSNRHHRNWFIGGQPVGLVVSARVVAHIVEVAEKERHRVELCHTRASTSWVFKMGVFPLILSPYQGPDGGTSRCPQCRGGSSRPTS